MTRAKAAHGGLRKGAGRPNGTTKAGKARMISLRLPPAMRERLDAVCGSTGKTHVEVMAMGIAAAEVQIEDRNADR